MSSYTSLPIGYVVPSFPSLTIPTTTWLYYTSDIWLFTLAWTEIFVAPLYMLLSLWAYRIFYRKAGWYSFLIPIVGGVYGMFVAFAAGSIAGVVLAFIYQAGSFQMSTWIPFLWGLLTGLMTVLGSVSNDTIMM